MNDSAIFDQEDWGKWAQERVNELEDQMLCYYNNNNAEIEKRHTDLIKHFYEESMLHYAEVPTLAQIMEEVWSYNSEKTYEIAEIEYISRGRSPDDDQESKEEVIGEIQQELESYYSDWQYANLEAYVEDILNNLKLEYSYCSCEEEHYYYELELGSNDQIFINDCQTCLFPEFLIVNDDERDIFIA